MTTRSHEQTLWNVDQCQIVERAIFVRYYIFSIIHTTTNVLASGIPVESGFAAAYTTGRQDSRNNWIAPFFPVLHNQ